MLVQKKSQIPPNCVPHALHTNTYLPPPNNPYNLILPPFGQKAERNPDQFALASFPGSPCMQTTSDGKLGVTWDQD